MKNIRTALSLLICIMMFITQFAFALEEADVTAGAGASASNASAESQKEEAASSDVKEEKPANEKAEESSEETKAGEKSEEKAKETSKEEPKDAEKSDASSKEKSEPAEKSKEADKKNDESEKKSDSKSAFKDDVNLDGVKVSVSADEGTFPEGVKLSVKKVSAKEQKKVDEAVNKAREDELNVAKSYTFDIKILDKNGKEVQPADNKKASVSFKLDEVRDANLDVSVYHLAEKGKTLKADELKTETDADKVSAETEGFSYYTVEFTYDNLQYVLDGDSSADLDDILKKIGLEGEASKVEVSNDKLFSAEKNDGKWTVTAKKAFTSTEWMKVTIDGIEYEIVVTDAQYDITLPDNPQNNPWRLGNNGGQALQNKNILVKQEGQVTNGGNNFTATIDGATFDSEKKTDATKKYAIVATNGSTINLSNITFNANDTGGIARGANANSVININGSTFDGNSIDRTNATGIFGNSNDKSTVTFNYTGGTNTLKNFKNSTIFGRTNITGGTVNVENSTIKYDSSADLSVSNGAILKLVGTSEVSGSTITIKSGGILDLSSSTKYSLDNLPPNVSLEENAIIIVKECPIDEVIVNNGESATIDSEGNITKDPAYGDQTKTIQGKSVKVRADKYKISETAPITVNNGGKLYFGKW